MSWSESMWFGWIQQMKAKADNGDSKAKAIVQDYIKLSLSEFRKNYSGVKK